jgi:hypothetical protein
VLQLQPAVLQLQLAANQFAAKLKSLPFVKKGLPRRLLSHAAKL